MKKIAAVIIAFASLTFTASAQEDRANRSDAERSERKAINAKRINARILDNLSLTETQKAQVKIINDDYRTSMQAVIKGDMQPEDRRNRRHDLEKAKNDKIIALLTTEQKAKLKELQAQQGTGEYKRKVKADGDKVKIKEKFDDK